MSQPFRAASGKLSYVPEAWTDLTFTYEDDRLIVDSKEELQTLSSAVFGGGLGRANRFVNWKVPLNYDCSDPVRDFHERIAAWGYAKSSTVGLITAAKLTHTSIVEETGEEFRIVCLSTAGVGNAARAGVERPSFAAYTPGTINSFIMIDARMTPAAMVNAIMTASEAKAAALQELDIRDHLYGVPATGTTTDAVVVAVSQSQRFEHEHAYGGTATTIGNAIGRLVFQSVYEAVATRNES